MHRYFFLILWCLSGLKISLVRYGVRSLKFIWAPCAQLYSLAETPQLHPFPRIWAHIRGRYWSAKIDDISLWTLRSIICIKSAPYSSFSDESFAISQRLLHFGFIPPYFPGVSMSISAKMAESNWSSMRRSTASTPALPYSLPRRIIVLYSTLLHLPPLRFHRVGGCWDRIQDSCYFGIGSQTL